MKRVRSIVATFATASLLVIGCAAPASALTSNVGGLTCGGGARAATYAGAPGDIRIFQVWAGGTHNEGWQNGSAFTTRVKIVPIGVATMTNSSASTTFSSWNNLGKDCRIW